MLTDIEHALLSYYKHYCELTIWFKKIVLQAKPSHVITIQDITEDLIAERNRILSYIPAERKKAFRRQLNKIATSYYEKVSHWSRRQKITVDMV